MNENVIKKNYLLNLSYQLILIAIPLITTPYLSRTLGVIQIGRFSYAQSILSYFTLLATMGSGIYGQREISKCKSEKEISSVFYEICSFKAILFLISAAVYSAIIWNFADKKIYICQGIEILAAMLDITWLFQGLEKFCQILARGLVMKIGLLIGTFALVHSPEDLLMYIILHSLTIFLSNIMLWRERGRYVKRSCIKALNIKRHILPILILFVPQIAIQMYTVVDKTMLGVLSSSFIESGYYEQAQKITKVAVTIVTAIAVVMLPKLSRSYYEKNISQLKLYLEKTLCFNFLLSFPMTFGMLAVSDVFVPWFLGKDFIGVSILLKIISPIIIFISINTTFNTFLISIDKKAVYTCAVICGAVINVGMNLKLIPIYGAVGASIASVGAELFVSIVDLVYIKEYVRKSLWKKICLYFGAGFLMFLILIVTNMHLPGGFFTLLLDVCLGCIIYFTVLLAFKEELVGNLKSEVIVRFMCFFRNKNF